MAKSVLKFVVKFTTSHNLTTCSRSTTKRDKKNNNYLCDNNFEIQKLRYRGVSYWALVTYSSGAFFLLARNVAVLYAQTILP